MTSYKADVVADSITAEGHRLTSMTVTFPRIILAEVNTHRALSRNSASSRAIPVVKMLRAVLEDPFVPDQFPAYSKGMQPKGFLEGSAADARRQTWINAAEDAVTTAARLLGAKLTGHTGSPEWFEGVEAAIADPEVSSVAKEITNRLLEPFMWHTAIISATTWSNFFALRDHPDAQRQIQLTARAMRAALDASTPVERSWGEWHLPFITDQEREEWEGKDLARASAARAARVSYLTHEKASTIEQDHARYERLVEPGHMSPLEHPAVARHASADQANFEGWCQLRMFIPYEDDFGARP